MDTKHRAASLQQQNYRKRRGTRDEALSTAANYITLVVGMCVLHHHVILLHSKSKSG